jgi:hypothetical protein
MAKDPDIEKPKVAPTPPAESGNPDKQVDTSKTDDANLGIDPKYWMNCLDDAERAESDWRKRGREIIQIYRNDIGSKSNRDTTKSKSIGGKVVFNILFANTETMLPAVYTKPPEPIVRARFTNPDNPFRPPMPGSLGASPLPPMPPPPSGPVPPPSAPLPASGSPPVIPSTANGGSPDLGGGGSFATPPPSPIAPPPSLAPVPQPGPPMPPPGAPSGGKPSQKAIETAASVIEKTLEIVVEDEMSHESVKAAIKDVLLPGRGCVRVRWIPTMEERPVMSGDGVTPLPPLGDENEQPMEDVKVWEQVNDEYVYWEDLLLDPVRAPGDTDWIAFRHLFTAKQGISEFKGSSPKFDELIATKKVESELCNWTEESAAKNLVGGGSPMRSAGKLGDVIKKMMVWEIWDRPNRQIIWFVRELGGMVLRVDDDTYGLEGFYPIPRPLLAVTTTDTQIPRAFYELYADLAADLDETSRRISNLTQQIKVRGGYNSASSEIAQILSAGDQKMLPVDGVDMLNGGLQNHIWLVPILDFVQALKELYVAREEIKQAIYEIMGISDIMRGATKASETATAQRIKGSMGMVRLSDQKQQAANFVTDLLRMKAELIAKNFDASTLSAMTGEDVTPEVMAILRSDFMRTCTVDIESDSTVVADMQEEQQSMQAVMMSVQAVMQGAAQMIQTGLLPPPQVIMLSLELLKMFLHPVRFSRGVVELVDDFIEQLQQQIAMQSMMPPAPPMPPPLPPPGGKPDEGGPPKPSPAAAPPKTNGAGPPISGMPVGPGAVNI